MSTPRKRMELSRIAGLFSRQSAIALKSIAIYRASFLFAIVGLCLSTLVQCFVWGSIYSTSIQKLHYMLEYVVVATLLTISVPNMICEFIAEKVKTGEVEFDLIRPVHPLVQYLARAISMSFVAILGRGVLVLLALLFILASNNPIFFRAASFLVALSLSIAISSLIYVGLGVIAFRIQEVWPFRRLIDDTIKLLSGALFPLSFFPWDLGVYLAFFPTYYVIAFPVHLALDEVSTADFLLGVSIACLWILALCLCLYGAFLKLRKWLSVSGG